MPFCSDLKVLFPKYDFGIRQDMVSITETSQDSKVKEVKWVNSDFQYFDAQIVKDLSSIFQKSKSPKIFKYDCDGIIIFDGGNGSKYMFLTELKSAFDSTDIFKARNQIISSFMKINLILNLVRGYNLNDFIVKGFIASQEPNSNSIWNISKSSFLKPGEKYQSEAEFVSQLCSKNRHTTIKSQNCYELKDLPLGENGIFRKIEFYYIPVPKDQQSITIDVNKYTID